MAEPTDPRPKTDNIAVPSCKQGSAVYESRWSSKTKLASKKFTNQGTNLLTDLNADLTEGFNSEMLES